MFKSGFQLQSLLPMSEIILNPSGDSSLVLYLNFDDTANPWKDSSIYNHPMIPKGSVALAPVDKCKYQTCADFTGATGDYLETAQKFNLNNGIAISFWIKLTEGNNGYFQLGSGGNFKWCQESVYGLSCGFNTETNRVGTVGGDPLGRQIPLNTWTHYFIQYDETNYRIWKDGVLSRDRVEAFGNLNYSIGDIIQVGSGIYGINTHGYMDEFMVFNRSNFTNAEVNAIFDSRRLGTALGSDIYVDAIKYKLPYDFTIFPHPIKLQTMPIRVTFGNGGSSDVTNFPYDVTIEGTQVCSGILSLNSGQTAEVSCNFNPTEKKLYQGSVNINVADDNLNNNKQKIFIPFMDRPWFQFSLNEWNTVLKPYCQNPSYKVPYNACQWMSSFVAERFQSQWTGEDIDPRAKKARENAMGCMYKNYDNYADRCNIAKGMLQGFGNLADTNINSFSNVHSQSELGQLGITFDIMFPYLTEAEVTTLARQYHSLCQHVTDVVNIENDQEGIISGGNGFGFGSGMGQFCYTIIGLYEENPTLIQQLDQSYWGKSIVDLWMGRDLAFIRSRQNDAWSNYQEHFLYKSYAEPRMQENTLFEVRYNLNNITNYNNEYCAMGREYVTTLLDCNYNGNILRGDENNNCRWISAGDTNSYQDIVDGHFIRAEVLLYAAINCNDPKTKSALLYLRDMLYDKGFGAGFPSSYLYGQVRSQASPQSPDSTFPKVIFDNANDILTIRPSYTYVDDDVIQIDGGEEEGGGHSFAQGYFLYALGEPFVDYKQVSFNDDSYAEDMQNGIALQLPPAVTGSGSTWSGTCGSARYNQYYGMSNCPQVFFPANYPNSRHFPLQYGGDLYDYLGSSDGNLAGVFVERPLKNAQPSKEYFVKFGDLLAKRSVVSTSTTNGIWHLTLNINDEFTETRDTNSFTFNRVGTDKFLKTSIIYSTQPLTIGGGTTTKDYCFCKTDCTGGCKGKGKYRRMEIYTPANNVDFILAHDWYAGTETPVEAITGTDNGLKQGNNYIIFDTNNDGKVVYGNKEADGWAIAFNDNTGEYAAFHSTYFKIAGSTTFQSDIPISYQVKGGSYTVNTMKRDQFIDYPNVATVTFSGSTTQVYSNQNSELLTFTPPVETCTESWACSAYSTCSGGTQTRTCTDSNSCGTIINKPDESQTCTVICSPNWSPTAWSSCSGGQQTRTIIDLNICNQAYTGTLPTTQSCGSTSTGGGSTTPSCSICSADTQCIIQGNQAYCLSNGPTNNYTPSGPSGFSSFSPSLLITITAIIAGAYFAFRRRR